MADRWEDVRAALIRVGDVTPAGPVTAVDFMCGEMHIVYFTVGSVEYERDFDAIVSRRAG